ncbi:MAG: hypothetical protein GIS02_04035 [Methanosarcinales archaeon]|uniref:FAD/NAD(P)-binding domain-containing protein n=1 Tax=Candidatus Ethanoperedens thermophilum TaxID=2766897 RepID=A0A848DAQ3_9EURY|nr:hypothetical protein [Candidatus Ethanoperedens thermophilum]
MPSGTADVGYAVGRIGTTNDLQTSKRNIIPTDAECRTSKEGVFAGGDVVTGSATVISAMGAGKIAARAIDQYLRRLR